LRAVKRRLALREVSPSLDGRAIRALPGRLKPERGSIFATPSLWQIAGV
jgi:hypothetical protein